MKLKNLKSLKKDMQQKGWVIDSFYFKYKTRKYIVLVKIFEKDEKVPPYALVKLEFLHENDFSKSLSVYANSSNLIIDARTLREFFGIEYSTNLGNILQQFNEILGTQIPTKVSDNKTNTQKEAMCLSLSKSDSKDPRKKYCFSVRRNPPRENGDLGQRSVFNDNKARLYRPTLYEKLGADKNLSFRFSMNVEDEDTDEGIIKKWTQNKSK